MLEKIVRGLAILGFVGGLNACTKYAYRDYHSYPGQEAAIAFYNIQRIGQNVCLDGFNMDEEKFFCRQKICPPDDPGIWHNGIYVSCEQWQPHLASFRWKNVVRSGLTHWATHRIGEKRSRVPNIVEICTPEDRYTVVLHNSRQAADFAEAIKIYLQNR